MAQTNLGVIQGVGIATTPGNEITILEKAISGVIGVLTIVAVLYFVFAFIFAGYTFISSNGDEKKLEQAKLQITQSIIGIVVVIVAVIFTNLIGHLLGISSVLNINELFIKLGL